MWQLHNSRPQALEPEVTLTVAQQAGDVEILLCGRLGAVSSGCPLTSRVGSAGGGVGCGHGGSPSVPGAAHCPRPQPVRPFCPSRTVTWRIPKCRAQSSAQSQAGPSLPTCGQSTSGCHFPGGMPPCLTGPVKPAQRPRHSPGPLGTFRDPHSRGSAHLMGSLGVQPISGAPGTTALMHSPDLFGENSLEFSVKFRFPGPSPD